MRECKGKLVATSHRGAGMCILQPCHEAPCNAHISVCSRSGILQETYLFRHYNAAEMQLPGSAVCICRLRQTRPLSGTLQGRAQASPQRWGMQAGRLSAPPRASAPSSRCALPLACDLRRCPMCQHDSSLYCLCAINTQPDILVRAVRRLLRGPESILGKDVDSLGKFSCLSFRMIAQHHPADFMVGVLAY